jgi:NAD(P) transhydrogenase subunit alpha
MKLAVLKETCPDERRVALVPSAVKPLQKIGCEVLIESGAGLASGYNDDKYRDVGAQIGSRDDCFSADVVTHVRCLGANKQGFEADLNSYQDGQIVIGMCDPLGSADFIGKAADKGVSLLALEMIPRITRAQSMDVLSSMACVAGYRAVILAAAELPKMFPLMMTAAGTLKPARAFVIGAGVAGLQAIATAKRLGAVVHAYDVRPAVREQVESLGGKFVELELDTDTSEDKGGYAKAMGEEFYTKQRELMASVVSESDIVITTAAIPGRESPLLITAEAVKGMPAGGVIVDLAAERGGNCELSKADEKVIEHEVTILGPTNLPSEIPDHASQMFSKNVTTLIQHLVNDEAIKFDLTDEITAGTLATHEKQVLHPRIRDILGLETLPEPEPEETTRGETEHLLCVWTISTSIKTINMISP